MFENIIKYSEFVLSLSIFHQKIIFNIIQNTLETYSYLDIVKKLVLLLEV